MHVVSVNVSNGRCLPWRGKDVLTGICKEPVAGRIAIRESGLDGDRQVDTNVHGGTYKAVYAYGRQHYDWWRQQLGRELPLGMFGENLTIEGLVDDDVCVGDVFAVGSARLMAVQPRQPCGKLAARFEDEGIVAVFLASGRFGVYFRVLEEGDVGVGDAVERVEHGPGLVPGPDLVRALDPNRRDPAFLRRALDVAPLSPGWAERFRGWLDA